MYGLYNLIHHEIFTVATQPYLLWQNGNIRPFFDMLPAMAQRIAANPRAFNSSRRRRLVCLSSHGGTRDGQQQRAAPREELIAEFAPDAWPAYFTARASMAGAAGSSVVQAAGMTPLGSPHDDLCWLKTSFGADWGSASKVNHPWDSEVRKLLRVL